MSKLRELLRLKYAAKLSHRAIAKSLSISSGTVSNMVHAAAAKGLSWPLPAELDDDALEANVYGVTATLLAPRKREPVYLHLKKELQCKGVTLQLLWQEYGHAIDDDERYSYSQFCERYRQWCRKSGHGR